MGTVATFTRPRSHVRLSLLQLLAEKLSVLELDVELVKVEEELVLKKSNGAVENLLAFGLPSILVE